MKFNWNKKKSLILAIFISLFASGLITLIYFNSKAAPVLVGNEVKKNEQKFVTNQLLVKLNDKGVSAIKKQNITPSDTGIPSLNEANGKLKATKVEKVFKDGPSDKVLDKWYLVTFKGKEELKSGEPQRVLTSIEGIEGLTMQGLVSLYKKSPEIESAIPNYIAEASTIPNDYYYSTRLLYADHDDMWDMKKIGAEQAWDKTTGNNVVVAVVDTGVDYNHPDLKNNIYRDATGKIIGYDYVNNDADPMDDYAHGTHVAGTIAASGNNDPNHAADSGTRVVGVGWNLKVMPVKGLSASGSGYSNWLANCLKFAADNGAKVINNSWGSNTESDFFDDINLYVYNKGVVNVYAAGNSNADVNTASPAGNPNVITVGASNFLDKRAGFSNYGANMDFLAPGGDSASAGGINDYILSIRLAGSTKLPATLGDYYAIARGTSMAAPHAAGSAALVLAAHPDYSVEEVRFALRNTADKVEGVTWNTNSGFGRINVGKAVSLTTAPPVAKLNLPEQFGIMGEGNINNIYGIISAKSGVKSWSLSYAPLGSTSFTNIVSGATSMNGLLGTLNSSNLGTGDFALKLEAVDNMNQISQDYRPLKIDKEILSGWPKATRSDGLAAFADVNGDGKNEIIYGDNNGYVHALTTSGTNIAGFPVSIYVSGAFAAYAEAITTADVDSDNKQEIVVTVNYAYLASSPIYNTLSIINNDGKFMTGWPTTISGSERSYGHPTVADINNDGKLEILVYDQSNGKLFAYNIGGSVVSGWPVAVANDGNSGDALYPSVAASDINNDSMLEIFIGCGDGKVYGYKHTGVPLTGWPVIGGGKVSATVGISDVNGDGKKEILANMEAYNSKAKISAWNSDGTLLWTYAKDMYATYPCSASFGFLDASSGLGLEVFAATNDLTFAGLKGDGTSLLGWPVRINSFYSSPAIFDMNGDSIPELMLGNLARAVDINGNIISQKSYTSTLTTSITAADFDGDGRVEYALMDYRGMLYIWKLSNTSVAPNALVWPQYMGNAQHTGVYSGTITPPPADNTPPTTTITVPANGATVSGKVAVTATASDNVGVSKVELYRDTSLVAADSAAPYEFQWDTTTLANGSYTLQTKAFDYAGNVGSSTQITVNVNNVTPPTDNEAPSVSMSSPYDGYVATRRSTIALSATANDNVGVTRVLFYVNGSLVATDTTSPFSVSWLVPNARRKTYNIKAVAYDAAGNVGTSATIYVTVK